MKLKRLDIHGFKSFYHRTTLAFDDGVTAVVGPNGCGKSNIVDAIKWVMGEQGARSLRGSTMEDIIFGGSGKRGPMGMCEVGVVFENVGPVKINGELVNPTEIGIERRLERGRGSDYLLNRRRCRLMDVQELVAGTGVGGGPGGRRAYAIIEQGQISRIVSAKAEDRRVLIEEAAGITVYRQRRKVAERKFAETNQNLERVLDIIGEVETQLRSLRRQAKKATRFKTYQDESRAIGLKVAAFEYFDLEAALATSRQNALEAQQATEQLRIGVEVAEVDNEALELTHKQAEIELRNASGLLRQAEERGRLAAERMAGLVREREVLKAQLGRAEQDASDGEERREEIHQEHLGAMKMLETLETEVNLDAERLESALLRQKATAAALLEGRARLESLARLESEELERMARTTANRDVARSRMEGLRAELAGLGDEAHGFERREEELAEGLEIARGLVQKGQIEREDLMAARGGMQEELDGVYLERDGARRILQSCLEARLAQSARMESLQELIARSAELSEGNRALLESGETVVKGPISELFSVPEPLEAAVLAALGHRLDGVVVERLEDAMGLVAILQEQGSGRGLCFALDAIRKPSSPAPDAPGVEGWLSDVLPEQSNPAAYVLLEGWLLVENAAVAMELTRNGWAGGVVTRDGERFEGGSIVEGGTFNDGGPLGHRRALEQMQGHLEALEADHLSATGVMDKLTEKIAEFRGGIAVKDNELQSAREHLSTLELDVERLHRDLLRLHDDRARVVQKANHLAQQVATEKEAAEKAEELCQAVARARTDRAAEIRAVEIDVQGRQVERDEAVAEVHEARALVSARGERISSARTVENRLKRQLDEIERRQARSVELGRETTSRLERIARDFAEDEALRSTAEGEALAWSEDLQKAQAVLQEQEAVLGDTQRILKGHRKALDQANSILSQVRLEEEKASLHLQASWARLSDRFLVKDRTSLVEFEDGEAPDHAERERLSSLDQLMQKMGDVNLAAIEECNAVQERHDFLLAQSQDLMDGLGNLQQAIREIDQTSKRLFAEAFESINDHFRKLFPRLFCGGAAELELTNPADLLNTGVHMRARPPGKKLQSVELMSGGEKAMCALALVFAVFRFNPSPFCLLDEVDAPLDDANIARFNEVVRELAQESQVVLVTHNKRTMEIADALYGVTMEEAGISKLVSVRMN